MLIISNKLDRITGTDMERSMSMLLRQQNFEGLKLSPVHYYMSGNTATSRMSVNSGGLARPQLDSADVRGPTSRRRHQVHGRTTVHQGVESADSQHTAGRSGTISLHNQHQPSQEQSHHATRQRFC